MMVLRPLILTMMLVILMPWGAWLEGRGPAAMQAAPAVQASVITPATPRDCRMAKLPGGSCAPEAVLPQAGLPLPVARVDRLNLDRAVALRPDPVASTPRRPPRWV